MPSAFLSLTAMEDVFDDLNIGIIQWPATTNYLIVQGGEQILRNRGIQTVYVSSDGNTTVQFGAYYYSGAFTVGSPNQGSSPNYFDGPWAVVPKNSVNHADPMFEDVEIWGDVSDYVDPVHNEFIITPRVPGPGQQQIYSSQLLPNSVAPTHLHPVHGSQGHFIHGTATCRHYSISNVSTTMLMFSIPNQSDYLEFQTKDGSGDASAQQQNGAPITGPDGAYTLMQSYYQADTGFLSYPVIMTDNVPTYPHPASTWPTGGPGRAMIAFCRLFPGAAWNASGSSSGGSLPAGYYSIRYCYWRGLLLDRTQHGQTVINGTGNNIETPLSPPVHIQLTGNNTNSISFAIPPVPSGWNGYRIYFNDPTNAFGDTYYYQLHQGSDYSSVEMDNSDGSVNHYSILISSIGDQQTVTNDTTPSWGFSAWPTGTHLLTDVRAVTSYLEKWAHLGAAPQTSYGKDATGLTYDTYSVTAYRDNQSQPLPSGLGPGSVGLAHIQGTTTPFANASLMVDSTGTALTYGAGGGSGSGGSSITNGGVTLGLDGNGHTVETGGTTPSTSAFNGTYFSGQSWGAFSTDRRGMLVLTCKGIGIPAMTPLVTITFVTAYTSQPFPQVTGMSWRGGQAGLYAGAVAPAATHNPGPPGNASFTIYNANALAPIAGDNLSFMFEISG